MKLLPQYSLRKLLLITTGCALAFSVVALGMRGTPWAVGFSVGVLAAVLLLAVLVGMFGIVWGVAGLLAILEGAAGKGRSPFGPEQQPAEAAPSRVAAGSPFQTPGG